jgi:acyl carrier protein
LPKVGELWNAYGPTEATVWVLFKRIDNELKEVAVGSPVANSKVHIIGETGRLLPPGVVGEICISGACLARGYRGQPELTSDKFRFHGELHSIVYHTGDLGYFNATDGDIYCLGRVDDQVKLRGYRIELDEISSVFAKTFSVDQAIALIIKENANEYITLVYREEKGKEIDEAEAKTVLQKYLPDYMVPSRCYGVKNFPVTPNGKIDKPATIKLIAQSQKSAPKHDTKRNNDEQISEIQALVIGVMKEALQVPDLSLQDNFFDVGGHSLLAMKTVMKVGDLLGIEIDLVLIFDYPAIGEFADQVELRMKGEVSAVRLESFFFGNSDRRLYGVFHAAAPERNRNRAVLLLYPAGQEYMRIHRAYRRLADSFSDMGFDVLRFDYACTGDSYGDFEQASLDQWIDSAVLAYDELHARSPNAMIDVVALRLGTVIARNLAQTRKIRRLVLWEPSFSDKYYWQQLEDDIQKKGATRANFVDENFLHSNGFAYNTLIKNSLQKGSWDNFPASAVDEMLVVSTRETAIFEGFKLSCAKTDKIDVEIVAGPDDWIEVDPFGGIILPEPSMITIRKWMSA